MFLKETNYDKGVDNVSDLHFLVVDDHMFSRQIVIEALKWLDAKNVTEAADGAEALQLLRNSSTLDCDIDAADRDANRRGPADDRVLGRGGYDCVITDFKMQNQSGLDLLKAIRTGDAKCPRDLPVLMLTGFSDDYLIAAALRLDVNAFVHKPVARGAFGEKLNKVLMRPIDPQSADAYRKVKIADAPPEQAPKSQESDERQGSAEAVLPDSASHVVQLEIPNIPHGSLLCADILGPNGAVMVHAGTLLSSVLLEKLWELHRMGWTEASLQVQVPGETPQ